LKTGNTKKTDQTKSRENGRNTEDWLKKPSGPNASTGEEPGTLLEKKGTDPRPGTVKRGGGDWEVKDQGRPRGRKLTVRKKKKNGRRKEERDPLGHVEEAKNTSREKKNFTRGHRAPARGQGKDRGRSNLTIKILHERKVAQRCPNKTGRRSKRPNLGQGPTRKTSPLEDSCNSRKKNASGGMEKRDCGGVYLHRSVARPFGTRLTQNREA